jgi:hypothetical protein
VRGTVLGDGWYKTRFLARPFNLLSHTFDYRRRSPVPHGISALATLLESGSKLFESDPAVLFAQFHDAFNGIVDFLLRSVSDQALALCF